MDTRMVVDNRYFGKMYDRFQLGLLLQPLGNGPRFNRVYFSTDSGNLYCIAQKGEQWVLFNADKGTEHPLYPIEMSRGMLQYGAEYRYGDGGTTTKIQQIICVRTVSAYEASVKEQILLQTDVMTRFARRFKAALAAKRQLKRAA